MMVNDGLWQIFHELDNYMVFMGLLLTNKHHWGAQSSGNVGFIM